MNDVMTEAPLGHNNPPEPTAPVTPAPIAPGESTLLNDLQARYPTFEPRLNELVKAAGNVPEKITDEETAGKVQVLIREMTSSKKQWSGARGAEKEPWQTAADVVYGWFKKKEDELDKWLKVVKQRHADFLETKAAEAKRAAEEKARLEREAAARAAKDAAEKAERERAAKEAEDLAAQALAEARGSQDADEQRWLNAKAEFAKARADRAVARRDKNDDAYKAADERITALTTEVDQARSELQEKRRIAREAAAEAERQRKAREQAERDAARATQAQQQTERRADRLEGQAANMSVADASRTRGGMGTVGTLSGRWIPTVTERENVPLEALRGYLHPDAIDAAITRWQRDHQTAWADRKESGVVDDALAGVVFTWQPEGRVA